MKLVILAFLLHSSYAICGQRCTSPSHKEAAKSLVEVMMASPIVMGKEQMQLELGNTKKAAIDATTKLILEPSPETQQLTYYTTQYQKALLALQMQETTIQALVRKNASLKAQLAASFLAAK